MGILGFEGLDKGMERFEVQGSRFEGNGPGLKPHASSEGHRQQQGRKEATTKYRGPSPSASLRVRMTDKKQKQIPFGNDKPNKRLHN